MWDVTDFPAEKPPAVRSYCPGCEPDADATREILEVCWCDTHVPARDGADDGLVNAESFLSGSAEAGGDLNRRWCEVIHRSGRDGGSGSRGSGPRHRVEADLPSS